MRHKTFQLAETKADDSGSFTALASVFGNVDLGGDRMMPGSFSKTLERWRESGDPIPVILSHQWDDPMAMVGKADPMEVVETEGGQVRAGGVFRGSGREGRATAGRSRGRAGRGREVVKSPDVRPRG
jgi:hypothetical protein